MVVYEVPGLAPSPPCASELRRCVRWLRPVRITPLHTEDGSDPSALLGWLQSEA
jgi:hypothetical protein